MQHELRSQRADLRLSPVGPGGTEVQGHLKSYGVGGNAGY